MAGSRWKEALDKANRRAENEERRFAVTKASGCWGVVPAYLKDNHNQAYGRKK